MYVGEGIGIYFLDILVRGKYVQGEEELNG